MGGRAGPACAPRSAPRASSAPARRLRAERARPPARFQEEPLRRVGVPGSACPGSAAAAALGRARTSWVRRESRLRLPVAVVPPGPDSDSVSVGLLSPFAMSETAPPPLLEGAGPLRPLLFPGCGDTPRAPPLCARVCPADSGAAPATGQLWPRVSAEKTGICSGVRSNGIPPSVSAKPLQGSAPAYLIRVPGSSAGRFALRLVHEISSKSRFRLQRSGCVPAGHLVPLYPRTTLARPRRRGQVRGPEDPVGVGDACEEEEAAFWSAPR